MENTELFPRLRDLHKRCINKNIITNTFFLTPREQMEARDFCRRELGAEPFFFGGYPEAERRMAFFLPDWADPDTFDPSPYLKAIEARTPFASPSHRDFLGSLMGMGIERECVGDILVKGDRAWFFLTPAIAPHVLDSMIHVGRDGVSLSEIDFEALPHFEAELKEVTFTVQSLRIDAIVSGIWKTSRSSVQDLVLRGDVTLNYFPCMDKDASVQEGDMISLRHHGKAKILSADGKSKKGRTFVTAGVFV